MASHPLELPTIQNWNCQGCTNCCRKYQIDVTDEERQRILDQKWSEADGISSDQPLVVNAGWSPLKKRYLLSQTDSGACVFLDEESGQCKIHAKFGEAAKPLACRLYPFTMSPAGKKVVVGLRFSCPSVVANRGEPVGNRAADLRREVRALLPENADTLQSPAITRSERVDWPDFLRFTRSLDEMLATPDVSIVIKLQRCLFWAGMVDRSKFDKVRGPRLDEFLEIISATAVSEIEATANEPDEPSRVGCMQFRSLVAQYARKQSTSDANSGLWERWRMLRSGVQFARGRGNVPAILKGNTPVSFAALEEPFGNLSPEADEMFTRYFRVKIQSLQFCGVLYFRYPLLEGFYSLALTFPQTLWLARWLATGDGRHQIETADVAQALSITDDYHSQAPNFNKRTLRRLIRTLATLGDIEKLCAWYSR